MSYLLTRIRRALAEPPQEAMSHAILTGISAHWESLFKSDPVKFAPLNPHINGTNAAAAKSEEAQLQYVTAILAEWEAKRAVFQLDATLGGPPGQPGGFNSEDWGTHWILFQWTAPAAGGPVWGYRVERSTDNLGFCVADVCIETEVTLLRQPQGRKLYYRVIPFNGWGDGPASNTFDITLDAELVDCAKRRRTRQPRNWEAAP